nr:hypothetical protein [Pseudomonas akapageensis]
MNLRSLIVVLLTALMLVTAGCASKAPAPQPPPPPPVTISEATWQQADRDIVAASQATTNTVKDYTRRSMRVWKDRVYQLTESDFIPWFTGYWTQQWLTMKVAFYKANSGEGKVPPEKQLAVYLQEQYHQRVIDPVAKEVNPDLVMEQATKLYVQLLTRELRGIAQRYGLPPDQFGRRLSDILAIELAPPPKHDASLYQVIRAEPLEQLPAYVVLINKIHKAAANTAVAAADASISTVAENASKKLEATLAPRGIAGAVSAAAGKVAGAMISIATAGVSVLMHRNEQPEMVDQLRVILNAALDKEWRNEMENPTTGVNAGVLYLSGKIEANLTKTLTPPVEFQPPPQAVPDQVPEQGGSDEDSGDETCVISGDSKGVGASPNCSAY